MNSATRFNDVFPLLRRRLFAVLFSVALPTANGQPANVQLPAAAHGSAAIDALGAQLPDVARAYGLEANGLVALLQTQPSLGVDTRGALLFACEGLAVRADGSLVNSRGRPAGEPGAVADAMTPNSSVTALANGATVDAFKLHSLPGVTRFIYLDFTGHTTSGTSWNNSYAGGAAIVSAAFSLDADPATFNETERSLIQGIWQRVAEDYAPFGVDVTTEDPGEDALRKTSSGDTAFGIRVVISPTNWYNSGAGGVAYINSFSWNTDTPCFAFSQQLANGEKYIAECVSHEAGHTLGLYHDGASGASATEYYAGHDTWAPIMGVGYYKPVVQFSKGEYANANNTQDDLTVVTNHVPVTSDDHGNTVALATALAGSTVATGGTIETRTDVDVFRFDAGAGDLALNLKGPGPDTNIDLKAELLNASGHVLQTSDSTSVLSASLVGTLSPGTYYVRVSSVGRGTSGATGYTNYGSLGNYIITGSFPTSGAQQPPVAVATSSTTSGTAPLSVTFNGETSTDSDGTIASYEWNFGNGSSAAGTPATTVYTIPGTYSAMLTVVDNDGLADTATITIVVAAAANIPPVASASASLTSAMAPVGVSFYSTGSSDPDGTISSYSWDFGDGTSGTGSSTSHAYSVPKNYTARLTVTDNRGATASAVTTVEVLKNPDFDTGVKTFTLTPVLAKSGNSAQAAIIILDKLNRPVVNATVVLAWSGVVAGTATGKTDSSGKLILSSAKSKKAGTATARITSVTVPATHYYDTSLSVSLEKSVLLK